MDKKGYVDLLEKDVMNAIKKANDKAYAQDKIAYFNAHDLARKNYDDDEIFLRLKQYLTCVRKYDEFDDIRLMTEQSVANVFNDIRDHNNIYADQIGLFDDLLDDLIDDKVIEK